MDEEELLIEEDFEDDKYLLLRNPPKTTPDELICDKPKSLQILACSAAVRIFIDRLKLFGEDDFNAEENTTVWRDFPNFPPTFSNFIYYILLKESVDLTPNLRCAILIPFLRKAYANTLFELDLTGFRVSNNLFANLLANQARSLKNIKAHSMRTNLNMFVVCKHLKSLKISFKSLFRLSVNQIFMICDADPVTSGEYEIHAQIEDAVKNSLMSLESRFLGENPTESSLTIASPPPVPTVYNFLEFMPQLRQLNIDCDTASLSTEEIERVTRAFDKIRKLRHLDTLSLTEWVLYNDSKRFFNFGHQLTQLCIRNKLFTDKLVDVISECPLLVYLDISAENPYETSFYEYPNKSLFAFVKDLRNLEYLDISGTNLHMTGNAQDQIPDEIFQANYRFESEIPALCALHKKLEYLGLYGCALAGSQVVPAKNIFSKCTEDQLLCSYEVYKHNRPALVRLLGDTYDYFKENESANSALVTSKVLEVLDIHNTDVGVAVAATASMFYLFENFPMTENSRHHMTQILFNLVKRFKTEAFIIRNVAMTLSRFDYYGYNISNLEKIVYFLGHAYRHLTLDPTTRQAIVVLMTTLIGYFDIEKRDDIGQNEIIDNVVTVLRHRVEDSNREMEVSWSFLWNITDDSLPNTYHFVRCGGLDVLVYTMRRFVNVLTEESLRNMLGLLGNVCEYEKLRFHIIKHFQTLIEHITEIMNHDDSSYDIVYNAGAVLANLMSAGTQHWRNLGADMNLYVTVYNSLIKQMDKFGIVGIPIINYHSLRPLFAMLFSFMCPASQLWVGWALANIVTADPHRYSEMLYAENGGKMLRIIILAYPIGSPMHTYLTTVLNVVQRTDPDALGGNFSIRALPRLYYIEEELTAPPPEEADEPDSTYPKHSCSSLFTDLPRRLSRYVLASEHPELQDLSWNDTQNIV